MKLATAPWPHHIGPTSLQAMCAHVTSEARVQSRETDRPDRMEYAYLQQDVLISDMRCQRTQAKKTNVSLRILHDSGCKLC